MHKIYISVCAIANLYYSCIINIYIPNMQSSSSSSYDYSQIEQKQQRFRIEIRRKQIDSILQTNRNKYNRFLMQQLSQQFQQDNHDLCINNQKNKQQHNCHLDSIKFLGKYQVINQNQNKEHSHINIDISIKKIIQNQLKSQPNYKWYYAFQNIGWVLENCTNSRNINMNMNININMSMVKQIQEWIVMGLIDKLQIVFQHKYWHLQLIQISSQVLQSLLNTIPQYNPILYNLFSNKFLKILLQYCNLSHPLYPNYPNCTQLLLSVLKLISTMLYKLPQQMLLKFGLVCVQAGIVQNIVILINSCGSDYEQRNKENNKMLSNNEQFCNYKKKFSWLGLSIQSDHVFIGLVILFRVLKQQSCKKWKQSIFSIIIPLISKYNLYKSPTKPTQRVTLKLLSLAASSQSQSIISSLFTLNNQSNMLNYLFNLITVKQQSQQFNRAAAMNIIVSLSASKNRNHVQRLVIQFGVLDKMLECYMIGNNHIHCRQSIFRTIANLVNTSSELTIRVLQHSIFSKLVLTSIKIPQNSSSYSTSIFIICSIVQHHSPILTKTLCQMILLEQHSQRNIINHIDNNSNTNQSKSHLTYFALLDVLLEYLKQSVLIDVDIVIEVMRTLIIYVGFVIGVEVSSNNYNRDNNNSNIIEKLQNLYDTQKILLAVQEKVSNTIVQQLVSILLQLVYAT